MASVNRVIIVGNLGADPETRYAPDGTAFADISLATTESWKDKASGEKKEHTEWHRVCFGGKLAEVVGQYLRKGASVYIEGKLRTRKWTTQEGGERYTTEIRADTMQMLGGRQSDTGGQSQGGQQQRAPGGGGGNNAIAPQRKAPSFDDMDDEIPFISGEMADDPVFKARITL